MLVGALDLRRELLGRADACLHGLGERGAAASERLLEPLRREADRVEIRRTRHARARGERLLELRRGDLGVLDSLGVLRQAKLDEPRAELADVAPACALLGELAERRDRDGVANAAPVRDRAAGRIDGEPRARAAVAVCAEVDALASGGLRRDDSDDLLALPRELRGCLVGRPHLVLEAHGRNNSPVIAVALGHAVAFAIAAQPAGPPAAPVVSTPAPHEISFGRVAGKIGPGTDRVSVLVDGRTFADTEVTGRRFELRVALPARDVRVRVVAHDFWGRRRGTTVAPVFGLPAAAAPRDTRGFVDEELARRVDELVTSFDGTSAVYVQDLATGAGAAWNAKARFPAASTVKVAIAIEVLRRLDEPADESSLAGLLEAMLVHSDNEASNELLSRLGGSVEGGAADVNALMESVGLGDSHLYGGFLTAASSGTPIPLEIEASPVLEIEKYTTAWDLAQLHRFLHLATGELGPLPELPGSFTPADARYLVYTLAHSADHGKLDRYLNDGRAVVPHKAGWISDSRHDAGLVYSRGGVFVVVVMTWNPNGVGEQSDVLAGEVARAALERFEELRATASAPAAPPLPLRL